MQLRISRSKMLSSSCLVLLATGLLLAVSTAYTSVIQGQPQSIDGSIIDGSVEKSSIKNITADVRPRGARFYQPQQSMDSYAAAYGAAGSPSGSDHSQSDSSQANDASSFASFGETAGSLGSASARELPSSNYGSSSGYFSSYMPTSSSSSSFGAQIPSGTNHHQYSIYQKSSGLPLGYPTNGYDRHASASQNYYDRSYLGTSMPYWSGSPSSGGLMSSASSALSHWTSSFSIGEIICALIAISIGAVILGAPFFLIYLALMGNFSGSGTLSLTNPTGTTTPPAAPVNGRRKRLAIFEQLGKSQNLGSMGNLSGFADSVITQLSPFIDAKQVSRTFKHLVDSIETYSNMKPEQKRDSTFQPK